MVEVGADLSEGLVNTYWEGYQLVNGAPGLEDQPCLSVSLHDELATQELIESRALVSEHWLLQKLCAELGVRQLL